MAPTLDSLSPYLIKRQWYFGGSGSNCRYYNNCTSWYYWGRWLLLGVIVVAAILFFWMYIAKTGLPPAYGTQWLGPTSGYRWGGRRNQPVQPQNTGPGAYYAPTQSYPQNQQAPPAYTTPQQQGTYYYGQNGSQQQTNGNNYEMPNYPPPTSPPPAAVHDTYNAYGNYQNQNGSK
ncbi:hypothetical protein V1512DRAFT_252419 [Lipomyces arxii]|uniref:uncharacterized protein n=1 Tax=Lipomyces arxii TaxID=56418 RepID=UPI0034CE69DB